MTDVVQYKDGGGVTSAVRSLLVSGDFLPGEQIKQAALAERLGVSRTPVREALKALQAEGFVTHSPHVGFVLARFSEEHLSQIYLMRRLLETELLREVRTPTRDVLAELRSVNARFEQAAKDGAIGQLLHYNRRFHFAIFELARMDFIFKEVGRLWDASELYRSLYARDERVRKRVVREHVAMIRSLETGNRRELIELMDNHREAARSQVVSIIRVLGRRSDRDETATRQPLTQNRS